MIGAAAILIPLAFLAWLCLRKDGSKAIDWLPNPIADAARKAGKGAGGRNDNLDLNPNPNLNPNLNPNPNP